MRAVILCVVSLLLVALVQTESASLVESENQLNELRANNENILVLFTRLNNPGCPECAVAADALEEYAESGLPCQTVIVDCDTLPGPCIRQEFSSLPQLLLFHNNYVIYQYDQPYIYLEALRDFVNKHLVPKTAVVSTKQEVDDLLDQHQILIAAFFAEDSDEKSRGSYKRAAAELFTEYTFAEVVGDEDLLQEFDATYDSIKMFYKVGEDVKEVSYNLDSISRRRVINWIDDSAPWVPREMDKEQVYSNYKDNFRALPILSVYLDYENQEQKDTVRTELERVSNDYRKKIAFVYGNGNDEKYTGVFERYGYETGQFPIMMLSQPFPKQIFTFDGSEITEETIRDFCDRFLSNQLEPHVIKQKAPEEEDGPVKTIVHDTWRSIVHDGSKDVAVFYYLPPDQCPHCGAFMDVYEKVAQSLADQPDLAFGKIDVNVNAQVPGLRVANFPTIQLFPVGKKFTQLTYSGPRNEDAVRSWIMENISHGVAENDMIM